MLCVAFIYESWLGIHCCTKWRVHGSWNLLLLRVVLFIYIARTRWECRRSKWTGTCSRESVSQPHAGFNISRSRTFPVLRMHSCMEGGKKMFHALRLAGLMVQLHSVEVFGRGWETIFYPGFILLSQRLLGAAHDSDFQKSCLWFGDICRCLLSSLVICDSEIRNRYNLIFNLKKFRYRKLLVISCWQCHAGHCSPFIIGWWWCSIKATSPKPNRLARVPEYRNVFEDPPIKSKWTNMLCESASQWPWPGS